MQVKKIKQLLAVCLTLIVVILTGCGRTEAPAAKNDQKSFLTVTDDAGRTVSLEKKPERIVVLSTSFLELLYAVDGKAVGRPSSKTSELPAAALDAAEVGYVYNINIEKVVALQPDLVIAFQGIHDKLLPVLESNKVPVILVRMKTYQDINDKVKLFGVIAGTESKGNLASQEIDAKINTILAKVPAKEKSVVILHATAKSVTVELENSIAGSVAKMLKLKNVAAGSKALESDQDATPYSLEKLVESNPDKIFIVTMGQSAEVEKRMKADVESNPAWSALDAVKNQQVYFLPQEFFLLNPGLKYPDAVEYMAKLAYPEVFANGR
ncbi:ABC transporter substrate-binding protein [Dendrosporobacter sp. 1207_IL3150]|uniref:ABC transporter substrate-binding protein n=1 Tax=Dendrosporobacter sp. 1207_IL3150 TaxID=3084054 RepID=UPI002FD8BB8B